MTQKKKPVLRFKGFTDDWEQRKLGKLAEFNPKASLPDSFEYVDLESVVGTRIINHRTEKKDSAPSRAQRLAQPGDVFYQTVRPYQRNNCLFTGAEKSYVFSTGYAQLRSHGDSYFLLTMLQKDDFVNSVMDRCTGTSYPAINSNELAEINVIFPTIIQEQKELGQFFKNIDNLITLHQRKYEKLRNLKKFFLKKMFPQNGKRVPEVRFAGFRGDWEQRKLGDVFVPLQNNTLPRANLNDEHGVALNIHYGDVLIKYGEFLNIAKEHIPYITDEKIVEKFKKSYLQNGDMIVADTAEDETVGKCTEIDGITKEIVISGLHTIPLRPIKKFAKGYLGSYLNSDAYHNQLKILMQGIKVTSISKSAMLDTHIMYPVDLNEQKKIGQYFLYIDTLITLHQRKLEKLQNLKKAALDKMFV